MAILGPYNPDNGTTRVEFKAVASESRTATGYSITITVYAQRTSYYASGTSGTLNIMYYINDTLVKTSDNRDTTIYGNEGWVNLGSYTYTSTLDTLSSSSVKVGFASRRTYGDGPEAWNLSVKSTTVTINAYATHAGGATVDSIVDNGNNTLTITTTMGADGNNNAISNVHIYGFVNRNDGRPAYGNDDFGYSNGVISGRTVTFTIPAPSTDASYTVRICAYSISALGDNPFGETVNSGTCHYHSLTVNYYSNYATEAFDGALNSVGADKNVLVGQWVVTPQSSFPDNLHNYVEVGSTMYLGRKGYTGTGYWGTEPNGGTLIHQQDNFNSYSDMASRLGVSTTGQVIVNLYPQWKSDGVKIYVRTNEGLVLGTLYARKSVEGVLKPALELYQRQGNTLEKLK